ncbi:MAG: FAD-binding protein [Fimbriimonadaceae bacterium]|nr:MAG: FAD-binding protein [Fimbriimonadaceae bacterium]
MSRTLLIAFDAGDALNGAAFCQQTGAYDVIQVMGEPKLDLGAETVTTWNLPSQPPAEYLANALKDVCANYTRIVAVSSMQAKDGLARLAGLLDWPMITDVIELLGETKFKRPILAGSVITTVELNASTCLLTFRPAGFGQPTIGGNSKHESIKPTFTGVTKRVSATVREGGRPDLSSAKVVVSGGRPLKDAETFEKVIGGLADALGGAVGATRAAVDSGIAANELQVGQTGKIVAPDLYIAAGISGSTQHMAGIKDSKVIVAINTDGDAPIFDAADFGLVMDLYEAVPELTEKLKK